MCNTYNLQRFVDAQEDCYNLVLTELNNGRKQSHWIWFIFPQQKGLGRSYYSEYYGLDGVDEAKMQKTEQTVTAKTAMLLQF